MNRMMLYTAMIYIAVGHAAQVDTDDGGSDDAHRILTWIEKKPLLTIEQVADIKPIRLPKRWNEIRIAPDWLIKRMSQIQAAVVKLRKSYEKIMRDHAAWMCRWMEVHLPEYFACATTIYIDLVVDDCRNYPNGLLMTIKHLKELYIKSSAKKIPIYKLNLDIWKKTEYNVNGLIPAIEEHRKMLEELVIDKIKGQANLIKFICRLPTGDRHPPENTTEIDPTYVSEEDYSPHVYNRL